MSWFQSPVSATANPAERDETLRERSIPNEIAIPIGAPPGTIEISAVEAWVTRRAARKPSRGITTIHGKANVTTFRTVATASTATQPEESVLSRLHTSPYLARLGSTSAKATATIPADRATPAACRAWRPRSIPVPAPSCRRHRRERAGPPLNRPGVPSPAEASASCRAP